tara:strand:- start:19162 stop:19887 length:726 start_codon:yes stop_codon:yes gene_type:complete
MTTTTTLSHEIAGVLRDEILRQQYRSGERFPSERDLATRFDASRGAVREALPQLEQLGLIRVQPGGARVQSVDSASIGVLGPLLALSDVPDAVLVDQFLQTFGVLTVLITRTAVDVASTEQLSRLKKLLLVLADGSSDFDSMQPQWREFLEAMSVIADNLVVRLISNDLQAQFVDQMMKPGIHPKLKKNSIKRLLGALRVSLNTQDSELAAEAMQEHFEELRVAVREAIDLKIEGLTQQAV